MLVALVAASDQGKKDKRGVYGEALGYDAGLGLSGINSLAAIPAPSYGVPAAPAYGLPGSAYGAPVDASIQSVLVEKQVAYGIPQPYPVPIEKPVPYAVKVPFAVPFDREVPVPVDRPYPVPVIKHVPVDREVPVPVDRPYPVPVIKHVPYEVRVPVKVPVIKHVPYPVEKIIREPVYIEKHAPPPPIKIIVRKTTGWKLGGGLGHLGGGWD
ncbi:hypothetical protein FOCC_FOCC001007 [Frankliniella occidentalis]|nr:hypothetical protein FOCC_FOCC001007 [Frankliniella occidentalis]